uniref:Uncharacterized protein n=1 Tax=Anguilla anguilla TaxID=7936 RepID=A0A0E9STD7_ANGAN
MALNAKHIIFCSRRVLLSINELPVSYSVVREPQNIERREFWGMK